MSHRRARARLTAASMVLSIALMSTAIACAPTTTSTGASGAQPSIGAGQPSADEGPPKDGGAIAVGLIAEPASLLPSMGRFTPPDLMVARAVYDPLVILGDDGEWRPYLAESMTPDATAQSWTIKLRPNITFHNGEKLDAEALIANFDAFRASPITGGAFAVLDSTNKVDDLSVLVHLTTPVRTLPYSLLGQGGFVVAPAQLAAKDGQNPIGTGPFVFNSWTKGQVLKVSKNPNYWQKGLPHLDGVSFKFLTDPQSRANALTTGEIDLVHDNRPVNVERWARDNDLPANAKLLLDNGEGDELTIILNTQSGIMADESLRRAMALTTDRTEITNTISDGTYEVADSPYGNSSKWHSHVDWPTPNVDQAKALVDAWKAAHGGEAPVIRLSTPPDTDFGRIAQVLQASWQAAGFDAKIEQYEQTAFTLNLVVGKFDAAIAPSFHGDDPAAEEPFITQRTITLPGFLSINFPRYGSTVVDDALKAGRETLDVNTRKAAYARIWNDYATHFPYLFLFHMRWAIAYNGRMHGIGKLVLPDQSPVRPVVWGTTMLSSIWVDK